MARALESMTTTYQGYINGNQNSTIKVSDQEQKTLSTGAKTSVASLRERFQNPILKQPERKQKPVDFISTGVKQANSLRKTYDPLTGIENNNYKKTVLALPEKPVKKISVYFAQPVKCVDLEIYNSLHPEDQETYLNLSSENQTLCNTLAPVEREIFLDLEKREIYTKLSPTERKVYITLTRAEREEYINCNDLSDLQNYMTQKALSDYQMKRSLKKK